IKALQAQDMSLALNHWKSGRLPLDHFITKASLGDAQGAKKRKILIDAGVDEKAIEKNGQWHAVLEALQKGEAEKVSQFLCAGNDINGAYANTTLLHAAVSQVDYNKPVSFFLIEPLIKAGAQVNVTDTYGRTPLMYACRRFNKWGIRELNMLLD